MLYNQTCGHLRICMLCGRHSQTFYLHQGPLIQQKVDHGAPLDSILKKTPEFEREFVLRMKKVSFFFFLSIRIQIRAMV